MFDNDKLHVVQIRVLDTPKAMYSQWSSLQEEIHAGKGYQSVLNNFPPVVGQDVAGVVVRHIAANLSISTSSDEPSNLKDDNDVKWTMEVCILIVNQGEIIL